MRFYHLILLSIAVMATACSGNEQTLPEPPETTFQTYGKSHVYALRGLKTDFGPENDMTVCDSIALIMPVVINDVPATALCDTIVSHALGLTGIAVTEAMDRWLDECALQSGCPVDSTDVSPDMVDGFHIVTGRIVNMTTEILTYCIDTRLMHPGAANGVETLDYINYSMQLNAIITLADLFTPEGLKKLPEAIAARAQDNPKYADQVSIDALPDGGNFYISSEGEIVFSYQPMEAGPHCLGNVQIAFYPEELVEYMTPRAVAKFGLADIADL